MSNRRPNPGESIAGRCNHDYEYEYTQDGQSSDRWYTNIIVILIYKGRMIVNVAGGPRLDPPLFRLFHPVIVKVPRQGHYTVVLRGEARRDFSNFSSWSLQPAI
jgi:hypothetical protein